MTAGGEPYIEGIGDEVVGFAALCVCFLPIAILFIRWFLQRGRSPISTAPDVIHYRNTELQRNLQQRGRTTPDPAPPPPHNARASRAADTTCPICISNVEFPCETSCGHIFCTLCLCGYWRSIGSWINLPCPCCRRRINFLLEAFDDRGADGAAAAIQEIAGFNDAVSQSWGGVLSMIRQIPVLLRRLVTEPFAAYRVLLSLRVLALLFTLILYLLSPLDLVPESVFGGLGLLDDFMILCAFVLYFFEVYRAYLLANQR